MVSGGGYCSPARCCGVVKYMDLNLTCGLAPVQVVDSGSLEIGVGFSRER